jgi:lipopolysaccharide transport system ATP-binding protein
VSVLAIDGLGKMYRLGTKVQRELWALKDVSFVVDRGTILGVIGPNAAGKTTLLKVISRVTRPTTGRIVGEGRVVPLLALGAGFQPDLSGRDNVFMNAAMYGIPAKVVEQHLDEIVEFAGIGNFMDVPVKRYSSGMYLRLAFSVAVNMRPDILLADEVLAVGDLEFQERCLERVQRAGEDGMAVLFVSHDMEAIRRLCHRVLWLDAGQIVMVGDPEEVTAAYENRSAGVAAAKRRDNIVTLGGQITSVKLTSGGHEIGAARVSDQLEITITAEVTESDVVVLPRIDVRARGIVAFRSVAPEWMPMPAPGVISATVRIPPHLLADTVYSVDVAVAVRRGEQRMPIILQSALSFHVYDTAEREGIRGFHKGEFGGIMRPHLRWELAHVPGASASAASEDVSRVR